MLFREEFHAGVAPVDLCVDLLRETIYHFLRDVLIGVFSDETIDPAHSNISDDAGASGETMVVVDV